MLNECGIYSISGEQEHKCKNVLQVNYLWGQKRSFTSVDRLRVDGVLEVWWCKNSPNSWKK